MAPLTETLRGFAIDALESGLQWWREPDVGADTVAHESRRALKRVRAILRLWPATPASAAQQAERRARDIARLLAPLRDRDVVIALLDEWLGREPEQQVPAGARRLLEDIRLAEAAAKERLACAWPRVAADFEQNGTGLLGELRTAAFPPLSSATASAAAWGGIDTLRARYALARPSHNGDGLHHSRKAAQRVLHQLAVLDHVGAVHCSAGLIDGLQQIAQLLGRVQDSFVLERHIAAHGHDRPATAVAPCSDSLRARRERWLAQADSLLVATATG